MRSGLGGWGDGALGRPDSSGAVSGKSNKEVLELLSSGFRLPCPTRCPQNIYRMMMGCWTAEPSKRPSFHALHSQLDAIYARIYFKTIEV